MESATLQLKQIECTIPTGPQARPYNRCLEGKSVDPISTSADVPHTQPGPRSHRVRKCHRHCEHANQGRIGGIGGAGRAGER